MFLLKTRVNLYDFAILFLNLIEKLFFFFFHFHSESTVEQNVSVVLNGVESELKFVIGQKGTKVKFYHQKKQKIRNKIGNPFRNDIKIHKKRRKRKRNFCFDLFSQCCTNRMKYEIMRNKSRNKTDLIYNIFE